MFQWWSSGWWIFPCWHYGTWCSLCSILNILGFGKTVIRFGVLSCCPWLNPAIFTVNLPHYAVYAPTIKCHCQRIHIGLTVLFFFEARLDSWLSCHGPTFCHRWVPPVPSEDDSFGVCWVLMLMREGVAFSAMGHNYNAVQVTGCHCSLELLGAWDRDNI